MGLFSRKKEAPLDGGDAVVSGDVPPEAKEIVDQLQHMFPGAHIGVQSKTITDPAQIQAALQAALGGAAAPTDRESARVAALERLAELHKHGALTDEEFDWEKKKILDAG